MRISTFGMAMACGAFAAATASTGADPADFGVIIHRPPLQVCADPNNLPFSNAAGEGFENALAELVAADFGTSVAYTWQPQRRGFVRTTLGAGDCEIIMGVPNLEGVSTTRRYYRSGYVFVSRADRHLAFSSMRAPELRELRVGVPLVGVNAANTPPAEALAEQGIVDNVTGYMVTADYSAPSPSSQIIRAVEDGDIDIAAVWGPVAGYFARRAAVPLKVVPITDTTDFFPFVFEYSIAMGVRPGDDELRARLNDFIARRHADIDALLDRYGVPRFGERED